MSWTIRDLKKSMCLEMSLQGWVGVLGAAGGASHPDDLCQGEGKSWENLKLAHETHGRFSLGLLLVLFWLCLF